MFNPPASSSMPHSSGLSKTSPHFLKPKPKNSSVNFTPTPPTSSTYVQSLSKSLKEDAVADRFFVSCIEERVELARNERNLKNYMLELGHSSIHWKRIKNTVTSQITKYKTSITQNSRTMPANKSCTRISAPSTNILAAVVNFASFENLRKHKLLNGELMHTSTPVPNSRSHILETTIALHPPLRNRRFKMWSTWDVIENGDGLKTCYYVWCPFEDMENGVFNGETINFGSFSSSRHININEEESYYNIGGTSNSLKSLKDEVGEKVGMLSESAKNIISGNEVIGQSSGIYVFQELAPNVTYVTLINVKDFRGRLPVMVVELKMGEGMRGLEDMRKRYSRDTERVDEEVREVMKIAFLKDSQDDQELSETDEMWDRCLDLKKFQSEPNHNNHNEQRLSSYSPARLLSSIGKRKEHEPWKVLDSPCVLTTMAQRTNLLQSKGKNNVTESRASCVLDCEAEDAMAFMWDSCSDTKMKGRKQESLKAHSSKSLTFFVDQHNRNFSPPGGALGGRNDIVCVLKKLPWPMKKIEFVINRTWRKIGKGYGIAVESVDPRFQADYRGIVKNVFRGFMRCLILIEPNVEEFEKSDLKSCTVKAFQVLNVGTRHNFLRVVDANKYVFKLFVKMELVEARKTFEKDKIVDQLGRDKLKSVISVSTTTCTEEEEDFIDCIHDKLDITSAMAFEQMDMNDKHVNTEILVRNTHAYIRATAVMEATVEDLAACEFDPDSRHRARYFMEQHGKQRKVVKINDHYYVQMRRFEVPLYKPREFVQKITWKMSEGGNKIEVGSDNQYIRSVGTSLFVFEKLPPLSGIPQTKMSYVVKMSWGGFIPSRHVKIKALEGLSWIMSMRKTFDRKKELDAMERKQFIDKLNLDVWSQDTSSTSSYTDEEKRAIEEGQSFFRIFQNNPTKKRVASSSASVINEIAFRKNDRMGWGLSETKIKACKEDILAFLWNVDANCRKHVNDLERCVLERHSDHHQIIYRCKRAAVKGYSPRYSISWMVWAEISDGSLVVINHPCGHSKEEEQQHKNDGRLKVEFSSICKIKETLDPSICKLTYIYHSVADKQLSMMTHLKQMMGLVYDVKSYFLQLRPASELIDEDGRELGEALSHASPSTVDSCFQSYNCLQQMDERFPWFKPMIVSVLNNSLHIAPAIDSKLVYLSEDDGAVIGSGLALPIAINLTNNAAVEEWLARYPALKEFGRGGDGDKWFVPMIEVIAGRLLSSAAWGMKTRVLIGGGVSLLDAVSDMYMIKLYMDNDDNVIFSYLMIGMIGLGSLLQLCIVMAQNWHSPWHIKTREMLYVICFVKPAVDAYRVAEGNVQSEHSMASPALEMMAVRCVELFAESLPSACLATYVVINGERSIAAVASILMSALSAGYTCAGISYDLDTNPDQRKKAPSFYGYVHDDAYKRSICFVCMVMLSALLLIAKSLTTGLLVSVSLRAFAFENCVEFGLFFLYKVYKRDVIHPFKAEGLFMTVLFSICVPIGTKVISDYTGLIFFRHPIFLGGFWSINMTLTFCGMIFATWLYSEREGGAEEVEADRDRVWRITQCIIFCLVLWVLFFIAFLKSINENYLRTFFNHESSKEYAKSFFHRNDDESKATILSYNARVWKDIRPAVKSWIAVNWTQWNYERPSWFKEGFKNFDQDLVPENVRGFMKMKKNFAQQRSTMAMTVLRIGRQTVDHGKRASRPPSMNKLGGEKSLKGGVKISPELKRGGGEGEGEGEGLVPSSRRKRDTTTIGL
ncbi:hypothetical protein TL16_g01637 [Triparma laevis f. inornata]|uniref:Uncharacterized protein n=1 Tax=Triparma laevis f. inornata TaxID=1714386 RepID=A0A9W6ZN22_9STRA|nr:hypothetical protein TL16_g01637 [Triparma laevis f. inornata]